MADSNKGLGGNSTGSTTGGQPWRALAIVIPAYKGQFLAVALASLAAQGNKVFRVYVGDDSSPEDLASICRAFETRLDLHCHRFESNLGGTSLPDQWNRCVELSTEPWVWLFADDDVMEPDCVARFYQVLAETRGACDLYRFNTLTIDGDGRVIKINRPHPERESSLEFAYHRLRGNRDSYASEYIFSRRAYDRCGGMARLPLAWCADDASWIGFATVTGIRTISGPRVMWRRSGLNITALKGETVTIKLQAAALFADDLDARFAEEDFAAGRIPQALFEEAKRDWFYGQLQSMAPLPLALWLRLPRVPQILAGQTRLQFLARLIYIHLCWLSRVVVEGIRKKIDRADRITS